MLGRVRIASLAFVFLVACGLDVADGAAPPQDHHDHEPLGTVQSALSDDDPVSAAVSESCTTSVVKGLSTQLIEEIQCLRPGTFASIEGEAGFTLGSAVFPWLQTPAREALVAARKRRGTTMTINSALRTLPQQYILYRWYKTGRCGIGLAASPGQSNHESALAVDIEDNAGWRTAMAEHDFVWLGANDPVHFDFEGEGQVDIGGVSVLAFQRLWNRNHPEDRIEEDSEYGTATEERLAKSPVGGFPKGAECGPSTTPPPVASSSGGSGGPLGAAGARREGESQGGCSVGERTQTAPAWLVLAAVAPLAVARRRRRPA